jgi:hypothetical protein
LPPLENFVRPKDIFNGHLDENGKVNNNISKIDSTPPIKP